MPIGKLGEFGARDSSTPDEVLASWNDLVSRYGGKSSGSSSKSKKRKYVPINYDDAASSVGSYSGTGQIIEGVGNSDYLQRENTRKDNLARQANIVGAQNDVNPEGEGFLQRALGLLARSGSTTIGLGSGTANEIGNFLERVGVDNPLDEWTADPEFSETTYGDDALSSQDRDITSYINNTLGRGWRGISGQRTYGMGDFEQGFLADQEDDGTLERAAKRTGAFIGDVATDPLTYMTFGAGAVGKVGLMGGLRAATREAAGEISDKAVKDLAEQSDQLASIRKVLEVNGDDAKATEEVAASLQSRFRDKLKEDDLKSIRPDKDSLDEFLARDDVLKEYAAEELSDQAIRSYYTRSARGLKKYVDETFDEGDAAKINEKISGQYNGALRGGLRFGIPFTTASTKAPVTGAALGDFLGNSGKVGQSLLKAADKAADARLKVAASGPVSGLRKKMSGEAGEEWDAWVRATADGVKASYGDYNAMRLARRGGRELSGQLAEVTKGVAGTVARTIKDAPDSKETTEQINTVLNSLSPNTDIPANVDPKVQDAVQAVRDGYKYFYAKMEELGVDIGEVKNYTHRMVTPEYQEFRRSLNPSTSKGAKQEGESKITKSREAFQELEGFEDGVPVYNNVSIDEANAQWRAWLAEKHKNVEPFDVFETDSLDAFTSYAKLASDLIYKKSFVDNLRGYRVMSDAGIDTVPNFVDASKLGPLVAGARDAIKQTRDAVDSDRAVLGDGVIVTEMGGLAPTSYLDPAQMDELKKLEIDLDEKLKRNVEEEADDLKSFITGLPEDELEREQVVNGLMSTLESIYRLTGNTMLARATSLEDGLRLATDLDKAARSVPKFSVGSVEQAETGVPFTFFKGADELNSDLGSGIYSRTGTGSEFDEQVMINNPLVLADGDELNDLVLTEITTLNPAEYADAPFRPYDENLRKYLIENGYDGLVVKSPGDDAPFIVKLTGDDMPEVPIPTRLRPREEGDPTFSIMEYLPGESALGGPSIADITIGQSKAAGQDLLQRSKLPSVMDKAERKSELSKTLEGAGMEQMAPSSNLTEYGQSIYAHSLYKDVLDSHFRERSRDQWEKMFVENILRPYQSFFKTGATIGRGPGYHMRNALGALVNNMIIGVTAKDYADAIKVVGAINRAKSYVDANLDQFTTVQAREDAFLDALKARLGTDEKGLELVETAQRLRETNIYNQTMTVDATNAGALDDVVRTGRGAGWGTERELGLGDKWYKRGQPVDLFSNVDRDLNKFERGVNKFVNNPAYRASGSTAQLMEEYFRTAAYMRGKKAFKKDHNSALDLVYASQFDYGDLSEFERRWVKLAVPFYTWSRRNVPFQFRALMTEPKYAVTIDRAYEGIEGVVGDEDLEVNDYLPQNVRERMGFASKIPNNILPFIGGDGASVLAINNDTPIVDLNKWIPGSLDAGDYLENNIQGEFMGSLSPLIKGPFELLTGTDTFTGSKIDRDDRGVVAPNWARLIPGTKKNLEGEYTTNAFLGNTIMDIIPQLGQVKNLVPVGQGEDQKQRTLSSLLSTLAGVPVTTLTSDQMGGELNRRNTANSAALEDRLVELGFTPEMKEQLTQMVSNRRFTNEQIRDYFIQNYGVDIY